jgi:hypothetical protein
VILTHHYSTAYETASFVFQSLTDTPPVVVTHRT